VIDIEPNRITIHQAKHSIGFVDQYLVRWHQSGFMVDQIYVYKA